MHELLKKWYDDHNYAFPPREYAQEIDRRLKDLDELIRLRVHGCHTDYINFLSVLEHRYSD